MCLLSKNTAVLLSVGWALLSPGNIMHIVLYCLNACKRVSVASPRFALHTLATPEHKVIISHFFIPPRYFSHKNKKCVVINTISTYLSTMRQYCVVHDTLRHKFARRFNAVQMRAKFARANSLHNTKRAVAVARVQMRAKCHGAKVHNRISTCPPKGAYADTYTIEQNICFAKICEAEFSKTHILRNTEKAVAQSKRAVPQRASAVVWLLLKIYIACKVKFHRCYSFFYSVKYSAFAFLFAFALCFFYDITEFFQRLRR